VECTGEGGMPLSVFVVGIASVMTRLPGCVVASGGRVFVASGRRARIMSPFAAFVKKRCGSNVKVTRHQALARDGMQHGPKREKSRMSSEQKTQHSLKIMCNSLADLEKAQKLIATLTDKPTHSNIRKNLEKLIREIKAEVKHLESE